MIKMNSKFYRFWPSNLYFYMEEQTIVQKFCGLIWHTIHQIAFNPICNAKITLEKEEKFSQN